MAVAYSVDWRGSRRSKKELDRLVRKAPDLVMEGAAREIETIMRISKDRLPVWQGDLARSAFIKRTGFKIELGYLSRYARAQHEGWPVGVFPSVEAIKPWAAAKLGDERLAFVVARAISERGFQGQPRKFLTGPIKERLPGMARRIARYVRSRL